MGAAGHSKEIEVSLLYPHEQAFGTMSSTQLSGCLLGENARARILVASSLRKKRGEAKKVDMRESARQNQIFFMYLSSELDLIFAI